MPQGRLSGLGLTACGLNLVKNGLAYVTKTSLGPNTNPNLK